MFLEHFSESKHQQQRGIPETNSEKPSLAEPISTAACYDWPTRTAKLARARTLSFTETAEAEAFHDPVSVTQTRRSESALLFARIRGWVTETGKPGDERSRPNHRKQMDATTQI